MRVPLEDPNALPLLVPVPSLDRHVVASREDNAERWVNRETSNIVRMCLEGSDLLVRVVIEDAKLEVVGASNEPVLPRNEAHTTNRNLCDFERFHDCAGFVIVNIDAAIVEACDEPGFSRVEVDGLDAI